MTPAPVPPPSTKPAALPLVALILGVLGFCIPPLFLVAIVLAIVSLAKGQDPAYAARKVMAIIVIVMGVAYVPVVGILAAIAIPNFIKFQAKSKQSECKTSLRMAYSAQKATHAEKDVYLTDPAAIGFSVLQNRYLYRLDADGALESVGLAPARSPETPVGALEAAIPASLRAELGVRGECPECEVTMACAGNIDNDDTIDVWSVSTADRTIDGEQVPAGTPFNHVDDTRE
jgi:hypothetical protein